MKINHPCKSCGRKDEDGTWENPCPSDDCPPDEYPQPLEEQPEISLEDIDKALKTGIDTGRFKKVGTQNGEPLYDLTERERENDKEIERLKKENFELKQEKGKVLQEREHILNTAKANASDIIYLAMQGINRFYLVELQRRDSELRYRNDDLERVQEEADIELQALQEENNELTQRLLELDKGNKNNE